jgi:hypothetical protein
MLRRTGKSNHGTHHAEENAFVIRGDVTTLPVMTATPSIDLPVPKGIAGFTLPAGVQRRLTALLDKQDSGQPLSAAERREAEGLVEMAEFLSLLKLRTRRTGRSVA